MMNRKNRLAAAAMVSLVLGAVGCQDNPSATAACKGKVGNEEACNNCCVMHGARGDKWVLGDCGCFGGK